jgi:Na+/H+ antiporter NhaD/arsenite permease-like protein
MISTLSSWLSHPAVDWSLGIFSILAVLASIVLVPRFLARLPADYLRADRPAESPSVLLRVLRNLLGVVLVLLGVAMLVLPGQGLLTLLVGLLLVDFPGKQQLVRRILKRPKVLSLVNKLRGHRGAPPLAPA